MFAHHTAAAFPLCPVLGIEYSEMSSPKGSSFCLSHSDQPLSGSCLFSAGCPRAQDGFFLVMSSQMNPGLIDRERNRALMVNVILGAGKTTAKSQQLELEMIQGI